MTRMSAAGALLRALKSQNISYVFCNPGSDFAPVIEELASADSNEVPAFTPVADERLAPALAHGYYLASGEMQGVMVHVNVGLANAAIGLINARADDIPMFVMSGRTPLTAGDRPGAKASPIQYGQEMYDQGAMVRELVKWEFELRYPETVPMLVARGAAIAKTAPCGPVYLSLPREPLAEEFNLAEAQNYTQQPAGPTLPSAVQINEVAKLLTKAERPLIICQRGDHGGLVSQLLSQIAASQHIPVAEMFATRNVMATSNPQFVGHAAPETIADADVILVIDAAVAWIESTVELSPGAKVIHLGPDPLFTRMPLRSYQSDLTLTGNVEASLETLLAALERPENENNRKARVEKLREQYRERIVASVADASGITKPLVAQVLSKFLKQGDRVFSERGAPSPFFNLAGPNMFFGNTHAGGLGWSFPAALGAKLADSSGLVVCLIGDGGYMLANPVACHHFAEANKLPVLTIVLNNSEWGAVRNSTLEVYPEGIASRANQMPLVAIDAQPDFSAIAHASKGWAEKVEDPAELEAAIERAIAVTRSGKRQALLDVRIVD